MDLIARLPRPATPPTLRQRLLRSHAAVGAIALIMMLATLWVGLTLRDHVADLTARRATGAVASLELRAALEHSVTILSRWSQTRDHLLRDEWKTVWSEQLVPRMGGFIDMQGRWTPAETDAFEPTAAALADLQRTQHAVLSAHGAATASQDAQMRAAEQHARSTLAALAASQTAHLHAEAVATARSVDSLVALLLGLMVLLPVPIYWLSHRAAEQVVEPVTCLSRATRDLAEGLLQHPLPLRGAREISELTRSFNRMWAAMRRGEIALHDEAWANSNFLAEVSHAARTPMNGILGSVDLLLQDERSPSERRHLIRVRQSGERLLRLLDALFDYARLEVGRLELAPELFSPRQLVGDACEASGWLIERRGLKLDEQLRTDLPELLMGAAPALRRSLSDLILHVAAHSHGDLRLEVTTCDGKPGEHQLLIALRDSGPPLGPGRLERMFEPFDGADWAHPAVPSEASGLELPIAARLAELLDGALRIETDEEGRNVYRLTLPCTTAQPGDELPAIPPLPLFADDIALSSDQEPESPLAEPQCLLRVLLAEDDPINQTVAASLLERRGHSVTVVANGRAALDALHEEPFDVVLMDVQMPEMDGIAATQAVRLLETDTTRNTPIIALTAHARAGDRERCLAAGMDAYLSKPLRAVQLISLVERCARS